MIKQVKQGFVSGVFIAGLFVAGAAIPAVAATKDKITGVVSSIDEGTGAITIIDNLVHVNASNATIVFNRVDGASLSDIQEGDIIRIQGSADDSGVIEAVKVEDPAKLKDKYDGKITGKTEKLNTKEDTFIVMGQLVDASELSGVGMGGKTISFDQMRSGIRVDVSVITKNSQLVAKKMVIRSESCNVCH